MMESNKWLETLKEGDSVFVSVGGWGSSKIHPDKVKRLTKTQIQLEKSSSKYHRERGDQIGVHGWDHGSYLRPFNDEWKELYTMQTLQHKMRLILNDFSGRININALTHEQLERLIPELAKIRDELIPQNKEEEKKE